MLWRPAVDVSEDKKNIMVEVEIPGMDTENVNVNIDGNILTIEGKKVLKEEERKKNYSRTERSVGSFMRSFTLPPSVNVEEISASYNKGILTILIPKKFEARRIEIK
jgi:HSP20 family protein